MEYKSVQAELKSIDEKGEGVLRFIRFEQEDKDGDITRPGFIGRQKAHLLPAHNWKSDHPPLGSGESFEADGATNFRFRLNLHTTLGKEWRDHLLFDQQHGQLQQISYGFSPYADGTEKWQKEGRSGRYLKPRKDGSPGAKLHEVSFVIVGSGNDTAVLDVKSHEEFLTDEEKATGWRVQSVLFPKATWESADDCRAWLKSHGYAGTSVDSTEGHYRFRQEDPGKFVRLATICIAPNRQASMENCRVKAVGGPMKESRSMEPEDPIVEPPEAEGKDANGSPDPEMEDWQKYPEDRRPPLPVMIKWLRMYRYHMPFLHDIRKRDKKEISPETISEFKTLVEEVIEVATQLNIQGLKAELLPSMEEQELLRQKYEARSKELWANINVEQERAYQQLQAKAEDLERQSRARTALIKKWSHDE
jgi:hypothetical protein